MVAAEARPTAPMATPRRLLATEAPAMIAATIVRMMTTADVIASRKSHDHYQLLSNGRHGEILPNKSIFCILISAMILMTAVVPAVGMVVAAVEAMAAAAVEDMVVAVAVALVAEAMVVLVATE